jgi:hypothetical protein
MKNIFSYLGVVFMVFILLPVQVHAAPHLAGTNIKDGAGTVYMVMTDGTRRPYTSAGAFLSYGFNAWSKVTQANSDDMLLPIGSFIPPQNGKILCSDRGSTKGTCYLISNGTKLGFTSEQVFRELEFSFSRALYGDVSFLTEGLPISNGSEAHRPGVLVNKDQTVFLVINNGLMAFPTKEVFDSWGFSFSDLVKASQADRNLSMISSVLQARIPGQLYPSPTEYTQTSKLTITSPTDGRAFYVGQDLPVSWLGELSTQRNLEIIFMRKTGFGTSYGIMEVEAPDTGVYAWRIPSTIPTGQYYIVVLDRKDPNYYDESTVEFTLYNPNPPSSGSTSSERDAQRLRYIRDLAEALEMYFLRNDTYPNTLNVLMSPYLVTIPTAPIPSDGACTTSQNTFVYTLNAANFYTLSFCLGAETEGYSAGPRNLSPQGIK